MRTEELYLMKDAYMATMDPTEYEFANSLEGGWVELRAMRNDPDLANMLDEWKYELAVKIESEGIKMMREIARTKKTVAAVKYLADKSWEDNLKKTKKSIFDDQVRRTIDIEMDEYAADLALLNR